MVMAKNLTKAQRSYLARCSELLAAETKPSTTVSDLGWKLQVAAIVLPNSGKDLGRCILTVKGKHIRVPLGVIPSHRTQEVFLGPGVNERWARCPQLTIHDSTIKGAGLGVFADVDIAKHSIVTEYGGVVTDPTDATLLEKKNQHLHLKCFENFSPYLLDGRPREDGMFCLDEMMRRHAVGSMVNEARGTSLKANST